MKSNRKGSRRASETIQVYSYDEASRMVPYVASVMRSVREYHLQAVEDNRKAKKLESQSGRPDRTTLVEIDEAKKEAQRAEGYRDEALAELATLDIYCLDPVQAQALIPFAQGKQLAWFVFELFEAEPVRFWRYQTDALETRRPISSASDGPTPSLTALA